MKINLSIIIPVYNAKKTIQNAINSINKQKLKIKDLKVEIIIIIDDGKKYENYIPKLKNWISIKIIKTNGIKTGPGNARNIGLKKANGKYIGFLDADDEWSESYITEMYKLANKYDVAFAPTKIYEKGKEIYTFIGKEEGYLKLTDIGRVPCSFHPMILKKNLIEFKNIQSQDVYNTAYILAKKNKIKMVSNEYYRLNIQEKSVTRQSGFSHKINIAYKKYQIICKKDKVDKVGRQFALRRIHNHDFVEWNKENNGTFYNYLTHKIQKDII